MSHLTTITAKRQLTIPAQLYRELGLKPGQRLSVEKDNGNLVLKPAEESVLKWAGFIKTREPLSDETIEKQIEQAKKLHFQKKYAK